MGDAAGRASSEPQLRQARMIGWTRAKRPVEFTFGFRDPYIIDACLAPSHQAVAGELPLLVAMGPIPIAAVVMPFIGKAHGDPIAGKRPHVLDQTVVELALPFAR